MNPVIASTKWRNRRHQPARRAVGGGVDIGVLKRNGFEVVEQDVEGETTLEQNARSAPAGAHRAALRMLLAQPAAWKISCRQTVARGDPRDLG